MLNSPSPLDLKIPDHAEMVARAMRGASNGIYSSLIETHGEAGRDYFGARVFPTGRPDIYRAETAGSSSDGKNCVWRQEPWHATLDPVEATHVLLAHETRIGIIDRFKPYPIRWITEPQDTVALMLYRAGLLKLAGWLHDKEIAARAVAQISAPFTLARDLKMKYLPARPGLGSVGNLRALQEECRPFFYTGLHF